MNDKTDGRYFTKTLMKWNKTSNSREMPWKGEKDPYKIWLSEIILQQTRVEQGLGYYKRFVEAFPIVQQLAKAPETKVFKLWEGLGYYTRCKNLIATAKIVVEKHKGHFPDNYETILELKGIGPYTAAAIASFAFNLPHAVVDGNVFRVLSRYFAIDKPIDSTEGKKFFSKLAADLLETKQPGVYNQAIMDFGATVCKPQQPLCKTCPLKTKCSANLLGKTETLPVKEKSITKKNRWLYYIVAEHDGNIYARKRGGGDIWENLYEFILAEETVPLPGNKMNAFIKKKLGKNIFMTEHVSDIRSQQLTHQTIQGRFIKVKLTKPLAMDGYSPVPFRELAHLPFPKFIAGWLKDKNVSLNLLQHR